MHCMLFFLFHFYLHDHSVPTYGNSYESAYPGNIFDLENKNFP